jgi:hypothetical protein
MRCSIEKKQVFQTDRRAFLKMAAGRISLRRESAG